MERFHWGAQNSEYGADTQGVTSGNTKPLHIVRRKRTYGGNTTYITEEKGSTWEEWYKVRKDTEEIRA